MKKDIFIFKSGSLKRKDNTLYFENNESKKFLPITEIDNIYVYGEVNINKKALDFLAENEVLVHFFNYYGYYTGTFYPREHLNSGFVILKQAEYYLNYSKRLYIAIQILESAIENLLNNLKYYNRKNTNLENEVETINKNKEEIYNTNNIDELMAVEGNIRQKYYQCFNKILQKEEFYFEKRSKRPPKDKINALISFGNSLMYSAVLGEIYKTHLDPRIGYLHSTNNRRFSLNLDIAEIFKPIITDRTIFTILNKNQLSNNDFRESFQGILLNEKGQRKFVETFNEKLTTVIKHPKLNKYVSYKTLIRMQLYKLQKHITENEELIFFKGRW